jgi:hypothetical protein
MFLDVFDHTSQTGEIIKNMIISLISFMIRYKYRSHEKVEILIKKTPKRQQ